MAVFCGAAGTSVININGSGIEHMIRISVNVLQRLSWLVLAVSCSVAASSHALDRATERYYAGFPDEATGILKPLALSGDKDAQYLLGNMLYSLSQTGSSGSVEDAVQWYKMAAAQDSAEASYAVGIIFHKQWKVSAAEEDARTAIAYYRKALELGQLNAREPLRKIKSQSGYDRKTARGVANEELQNSVPTSLSNASDSTKQVANIDGENARALPEQSFEVSAPAKQQAAGAGISSRSDATSEVIRNSSDTSNTGEETKPAITIGEIADLCGKYTQTGFNLYAETIRGGYLTGEASIDLIRSDPAKAGDYSINLTNDQFGARVILELNGVPGNLATRFEKGANFGVSGVVLDSKASGSNCVVNLKYGPV